MQIELKAMWSVDILGDLRGVAHAFMSGPDVTHQEFYDQWLNSASPVDEDPDSECDGAITVSDVGELVELLERLKSISRHHISEFAVRVSAKGGSGGFDARLPSNGYLFNTPYCTGHVDAGRISGNVLYEAMRARDILEEAISIAPNEGE